MSRLISQDLGRKTSAVTLIRRGVSQNTTQQRALVKRAELSFLYKHRIGR